MTQKRILGVVCVGCKPVVCVALPLRKQVGTLKPRTQPQKQQKKRVFVAWL